MQDSLPRTPLSYCYLKYSGFKCFAVIIWRRKIHTYKGSRNTSYRNCSDWQFLTLRCFQMHVLVIQCYTEVLWEGSFRAAGFSSQPFRLHWVMKEHLSLALYFPWDLGHYLSTLWTHHYEPLGIFLATFQFRKLNIFLYLLQTCAGNIRQVKQSQP